MTFNFFTKDNQLTQYHINITELLPDVKPDNLTVDSTALGIVVNHVLEGLATDTKLIMWIDPDKERITMTHEGVSPASGAFCEMNRSLRLTEEEKRFLFIWEELMSAKIAS